MNKRNNLYLTSNDFASFADVVYSDRQAYDTKLFETGFDLEIVDYSEDPQFKHITYKKLSFRLTSGDIVFCNTNQIDNLFHHLNKLTKIEDLILITHQTDKLITKKDFAKKPDCVKDWFTVNAGFQEPNLHPIPIGIASSFSLKNLVANDFLDFREDNFKKDKVSLYINFQKNTNFKERNNLADEFGDKEWINIDVPNLDKDTYMKKVEESSFVLCPWGNGIDTHRIWEALYLGSIPITKYHPTFHFAKNLPILFVDEYSDISYSLLDNYLKNFRKEDYNFEVLTKNYWKEHLENMKSNSSNSEVIVEKFHTKLYFQLKRVVLNMINLRRKKIKTFYYKLINKLRF